jgi:hypothetical protein
MTFSSWFSALPLILKLLVILGIVVGSFGIGASFVVSTVRAWTFLGEAISRRMKDGKGKAEDEGDRGPRR